MTKLLEDASRKIIVAGAVLVSTLLPVVALATEIPEFSLQNCETHVGDTIDGHISWRGPQI